MPDSATSNSWPFSTSLGSFAFGSGPSRCWTVRSCFDSENDTAILNAQTLPTRRSATVDPTPGTLCYDCYGLWCQCRPCQTSSDPAATARAPTRYDDFSILYYLISASWDRSPSFDWNLPCSSCSILGSATAVKKAVELADFDDYCIPDTRPCSWNAANWANPRIRPNWHSGYHYFHAS